MPKVVDPSLRVSFQALGRDTELVQSYRITGAFTRSTDDFEVVLYDTDRSKLRGLEMQPVELFVNGCSQMIGRVDQTEIGDNGSAITLRGRDYISDLVECNVDPTLVIKEGTKLDSALLDILGVVGITIVFGDDDVFLRNVRTGKAVGKRGQSKDRIRELSLQDLKPRPGEGLYEFCNRLVARFGVMIQPGPDRTAIVVQSPQYDQEPICKIVRTDDQQSGVANNIISASATRDFSSFPTYALFTGRSSSAGADSKPLQIEKNIINLAAGNRELAETLLRAVYPRVPARRLPAESVGDELDGRLYRMLYLRDDDSRDIEQLDRAAMRAVSERLRDTLNYSVTLQGHSDPISGAVYAVDTIIDVRDEICNINEPLWVESREFSYDSSGGAITRLNCWRPKAFQL